MMPVTAEETCVLPSDGPDEWAWTRSPEQDAVLQAATDASHAATCAKLVEATLEASAVQKLDIDGLSQSLGSMSMGEPEQIPLDRLVEAVKAYLKKRDERAYVYPTPRTIVPSEIIQSLTDCKTDADRIDALLAAIHPRKLPSVQRSACNMLRTFQSDDYRLAAIHILRIFPKWNMVKCTAICATFKTDESRIGAIQLFDSTCVFAESVKSYLDVFQTDKGRVQLLDELNSVRLKQETAALTDVATAATAATGAGIMQATDFHSAWFCPACEKWATPEDENRICAACKGVCTESIARRYAFNAQAIPPPPAPRTTTRTLQTRGGSPYAKSRVGKYCLNCNKRTSGINVCDECHMQY
jgi:hypothetical protein